MYGEKLPRKLKEAKYAIEQLMVDYFDLWPFIECPNGSRSEVIFEIVNWGQMSEIAAFGGFPTRYPHWRFGMEYNELSKGYAYGLQKIYEMVINNNPPFAYLLEANKMVDQKIVMSHVYAHCDFFFNNHFFKKTNRNALNMFANHAKKIDRIIENQGEEKVEKWIDICLSLETLIDFHADAIVVHEKSVEKSAEEMKEKSWDGRLPAKEYMDNFINPPEELEAQKKKVEETAEKEKEKERGLLFPPTPERDVMLFLAENSPLEPWQKEILLTVREEAYYFVPQAQTKILNEGWATFWHSRAIAEIGVDEEIIDAADHTAGTMAAMPYRINPYKLGRELLEDVVVRWDSHRRGKIYEECDDRTILEHWEAFGAFKNIYEDFGDSPEKLRKKWNEFLCFWKAVKEGRCDFPNAIYDLDRLLRHWHYYNTIEECLIEFEKSISDRFRLISDLNKKLQKVKNDGYTKGIEHYELAISLVKNYIKRLRRRKRVFMSLRKIQNEFNRGALSPEPFPLPDSFFLHAKKYPGKLEIGRGLKKIFEIRNIYQDTTAIDEFLTKELCKELRLFVFGRNPEKKLYEVTSKEFQAIKEALLLGLVNCGYPDIRVVNGNYSNRGELLLKHHFYGVEIFMVKTKLVMENIYKIYHNTVNIETVIDNKPKRFSFDGKDFKEENI